MTDRKRTACLFLAVACWSSSDATANAPSAPSNLTATIQDSRRILLQWQDNSDNERSFRIERATNPNGPWANYRRTKADVAQKVCRGLNPDTTYYFRVAAVNREGRSSYSAVLSVTMTTTRDPNPPTNLVATPIFSTKILLTWQDNSDDEDSFSIERAPSPSGPWNQIAVVGQNVKTFVDDKVQPGAKQYYRVRACIGCTPTL